MKRRALLALVVLTPLFGVACSGDDTAVSTTTTVAPEVGNPEPPLPIDINTIPYKPGELVALGDVKIQIGVPVTSADNEFSFDVAVTSGSFDPFTVTPEMFRVYTLDGTSYIPEAGSATEQFGEYTLQSEEVYQGVFSVKIPTDSEPVLFLADLSPIGDRYFPGAWIFDPNFIPEPAEG
jgi:hypothetical protein